MCYQNMIVYPNFNIVNYYFHPSCFHLDYKFLTVNIENFFLDICKNKTFVKSLTQKNNIIKMINAKWLKHTQIYPNASKSGDSLETDLYGWCNIRSCNKNIYFFQDKSFIFKLFRLGNQSPML